MTFKELYEKYSDVNMEVAVRHNGEIVYDKSFGFSFWNDDDELQYITEKELNLLGNLEVISFEIGTEQIRLSFYDKTPETYLKVLLSPDYMDKSTTNTWINVKDKIPEEYTLVWVFIKPDIIERGYCYYNNVHRLIWNTIWDKDVEVSHWMKYQLPERKD